MSKHRRVVAEHTQQKTTKLLKQNKKNTRKKRKPCINQYGEMCRVYGIGEKAECIHPILCKKREIRNDTQVCVFLRKET